MKIPANDAWNGKRVILTIGAADFFTDAWCNGRHLGHHEGGYTPFEFDLTDALAEENGVRRALLVFRVEDPMDNREQPVGKQWHWYTTTSGIWQTVFIEPRSKTHLKSFRFAGDIDKGTVHLTALCANAGDDCVVEAEIHFPGGGGQTERLPVRNGVAESTIALKSVHLWD